MKKSLLATLSALAFLSTVPAFAANPASPCPVKSADDLNKVELSGKVMWLITKFGTGEFVDLVEKFPDPVALSWEIRPCLQVGRKLYIIKFDDKSPKEQEFTKWEGKFSVTVKGFEGLVPSVGGGKDRILLLREIVSKE